MIDIVAEIGASHGQNLSRAKALVEGAVIAGATTIKLQTYTPDTISFPGSGICPAGPWKGRPLYELYQRAYMPRAMQEALIDWMNANEVDWFSTPFSPEDVDWLEEMGCSRYKISSFDVNNWPLVRAVQRTGALVILSDGMDRNITAEIDEIVLRCVSQYPAEPEDYGLMNPPGYPHWGISDHTEGAMLGAIAIAMGAIMIEKHIKLDGDDSTEDSKFATPISKLKLDIECWRSIEKIANSTRNPKAELGAIMPREINLNGKRVFRRFV